MRYFMTLCLALLVFSVPAFGGIVKLQELKTLQLDVAPKQVTITPDGRSLYVLTQNGQLQIYTLGGELQGQLDVDPEIDLITPLGPQHLLLQKTRKKQAVVAMIEISQQIDISNSPFLGEETAPVTIAVYDDFECPYCAQSVPLLKQVVDQYPGKVKLVFKNFPLSSHRNARNAALTALAANRQGKFWGLHDLLFENHNSLNPAKIDALAAQAGLDLEQLNKDRNDPQLSSLLERDINEGTAIGVRGTPTIYINGRLLQERSLSGFGRMIEEELASGTGQVPKAQ